MPVGIEERPDFARDESRVAHEVVGATAGDGHFAVGQAQQRPLDFDTTKHDNQMKSSCPGCSVCYNAGIHLVSRNNYSKGNPVMNSSKNKRIIGVTVLAAMVFIGGSYWAGKSTENTFRKSMEEMAGYGAKVELLEYQRGIFSATARTEWVFSRSGKDQMALSFRHNIRHGPFLVLASAASIRSELMPSNELSALFVDTLGGDSFNGKISLTVKSTFGGGGEHYIRIVSPKFEAFSGEGKPLLSWDGLDGRITMDSGLSKIKMKAVINGLSTVENEEDRLQVSRVTLQTDMKKARGYGFVFVGASSLVLNKLTYRGTDESTGAIRAFAFENARGETSTALKNGGLNIKIRAGADALVMSDSKTTIQKPGATFQFENIDAQGLDAILRISLSQNGESGHSIFAHEEQVQSFLKRKPAFSIKEVSADWPEGVTTGNFRFAYTGDGNLDQFSLADMVVDLQFSLPIAPINRLLEEQASEGYSEETKKQVEIINSMINKGFLTEEDGVLSADASLTDGTLNLKGQPKSLEVLQELLEIF